LVLLLEDLKNQGKNILLKNTEKSLGLYKSNIILSDNIFLTYLETYQLQAQFIVNLKK